MKESKKGHGESSLGIPTKPIKPGETSNHIYSNKNSRVILERSINKGRRRKNKTGCSKNVKQ